MAIVFDIFILLLIGSFIFRNICRGIQFIKNKEIKQ